jgi:hypothetical protein
MGMRSVTAATVVILSVFFSTTALAQGSAPATAKPPARVMSEQEVRDFLVWNSPWDSRTATPGQIYSYRTVFVIRRNELVAEVMRYSNNERGDSVVNVKEGRVVWQDSSGGSVTVAVDAVGELVGTATSASTNVAVVFKPRP